MTDGKTSPRLLDTIFGPRASGRVGFAAEEIRDGDLVAFDPSKTPNAPVSVVPSGPGGVAVIGDRVLYDGEVVGHVVQAPAVVGLVEHFDPVHGWRPTLPSAPAIDGNAPRIPTPTGEDGRPECARDDDGKARLDLIPVGPLFEVARLYHEGSKKYAIDQWRHGTSFRRAFSALLRHAFKWAAGQKTDPENGCHHLAAVVFWCFALIEWEVTHPERDDRAPDPMFRRTGYP